MPNFIVERNHILKFEVTPEKGTKAVLTRVGSASDEKAVEAGDALPTAEGLYQLTFVKSGTRKFSVRFVDQTGVPEVELYKSPSSSLLVLAYRVN